MESSPLPAFCAAAAVALFSTPLFRQLARRIGLVDQPAARKMQTAAIPYLGGMAVAIGTLTGVLLAPGRGFRIGAVLLVAVGLCVVGLLDDDRQLKATTRLTLEVGAALATIALGLRFEATGVGILDAGVTLVWIVGLTNATNLLDNMDGLGAGTAVTIATSSLVLVLGTGGRPEAALAAAIIGACLGFLAYNKRPATVYMGDAGSLFLGYLLSVVTLAVTHIAQPATRWVVPLMLAALPLADTVTVVVARLRRGISPAQAGKDHLSHRLVARGFSPGWAVLLLLGTSQFVGLLGATAGRGSLPLPLAAAAGAGALGLLLWATVPVPAYDRPVVGLPTALRLAGGLGIAAFVAGRVTGVIPVVGSAGDAPFLRSAAFGPARPLLLFLAFVVLGTALAVVTLRRRAGAPASILFTSNLLVRQLKEG